MAERLRIPYYRPTIKGELPDSPQLERDFFEIEAAVNGLTTGGPGGWDAIVDSTLVASDLTNRNFLGIGEALSYLQATVGLTRAFVLVRPGTYTETGDFSSPATVNLLGAHVLGGGTPIQWNLQTFGASGTGMTRTNLSDFNNITCSGTKPNLFGNASNNGAFNLFAVRCGFTSGVTLTNGLAGSFGVLNNCNASISAPVGDVAVLYDTQFADNGASFTISRTYCYMHDCLFVFTGNRTLTMPQQTYIRARQANDSRTISNAAGVISLAGSSTNGNYDIHWTTLNGASPPNLTLTNISRVAITGDYATVTIGAPPTTPTRPIEVACSCEGAVDITGPAILDIRHLGTTTVTLRGDAISGHITGQSTAPPATWLNFVGAGFCNVDVSFDATGSAVGQKSFNLDAASNKNILDFAGDSSFPVTGTDAGAGNVVRKT